MQKSQTVSDRYQQQKPECISKLEYFYTLLCELRFKQTRGELGKTKSVQVSFILFMPNVICIFGQINTYFYTFDIFFLDSTPTERVSFRIFATHITTPCSSLEVEKYININRK